MPTPTAGRARTAAMITILGGLAPCAARADEATPATLAAIEQRIHQLQAEIARVRAAERDRARRDAAVAAAAAEARAEAREAVRRANAAEAARTVAGGTGQSFAGTAVAGFAAPGGASLNAPPVPEAENGVGPHGANTVGQQKASALGDRGRFQLGGVSVTLGGYLDMTAILRTRNEVADVTSSWNAIPYPQSPLYHEPEFRESARSSRIALLVEGRPDPTTRVAGFLEADFKVAGISSNSNESNSYALGLRHAYATIDRTDLGLHVLAGQSWSLLTLDRVGITPRQEQIPLTIDNAYLPGFTWTRNAQLRIVEDFDDRRVWAGISFESPLATYYVPSANATGTIGGTPNYANPGGSLLNPTANYSDDIAPDVIAKLAFDPAFGHFEVYGVARFLHDRVTSTVAGVAGRDDTVLAGGGGAGFVLPLVGPALTFQASTLVGQGIGRYGEAQLPDATIGPNGAPVPLPEVQALLGLVGHPGKAVDLYAYVGTEQVAKRSYDERVGGVLTGYGYGNGLYADGGCALEGSSLGCVANTRGLTQGTLGAWWRFAHGDWGTLQTGAQYSHTIRNAFQGLGPTRGSTVQPQTDEDIVMFSLRYLPFL